MIDFTGIINQNEFYTNYYLSAILEQDLKETLQQWETQKQTSGQKTPFDELGALRRDFFAMQSQMQNVTSDQEAFDLTLPFCQRLLAALGYSSNPDVRKVENGFIPVAAEIQRSDGSPWLWVLEVPATKEASDPLHKCVLDSQYKDLVDSADRLLTENIETIMSKEIMAMQLPPRWILVVQYDSIILVDRNKWADKRILHFDLREILERREPSTLRAMAALLHRDCLCPKSGGTPLLDKLDDNSHKHAFAVSEDLKYAAREAVELMGNEAIWYLKKVSREAVFNLDQNLAKVLSEESLRYLYRLLFLFYLEARSNKLDYIPMKNEAYKTGYSLESLRDLEMVPLTTPESQNGYFFDNSIKKLFGMIIDGVNPQVVQGRITTEYADVVHDDISLDKLDCHLFDPKRTPTLNKVQFRNQVWQKIIRLLSLTRESAGSKGRMKSKRRGRVSYAQLGIIQLGAVYEGLLSYRGFFAETDLYEVKPKDEEWNPLKQAFFVSQEQLDQYDRESEIVSDENGQFVVHERGKFIYRLAGRDREKSASYYTPESLTQCLVKYALKELIGEKPGDPNYKTADEILNLTVCEPAMGSAAFLNEAINQLANAYLKRKQREINKQIDHDKLEDETQRVKMYLADRNVFGVDLNPVAVELAEISLWLNSICKEKFVPWFGGQLISGNSLIGARKQIYESEKLKENNGEQNWRDIPPERVKPGAQRPFASVYHFLLPDPGMAEYTDKVIKTMEPENIQKIKEWKKEFCGPLSIKEIAELEHLSELADICWNQHAHDLRQVRDITTDKFSIFGHEDTAHGKSTVNEKDKQLLNGLYVDEQEKSPPFRRLKMVMDYWCALWFWPIERADDLPTRDEFLMEMEYILQRQRLKEESLVFYEKNGQMLLIPPETVQSTFDFGLNPLQEAIPERVNIDELCDTFPRLALVRDIAKEQRFLHWELEFADIFADKGGFDLILGNPPWVKLAWNESGLLSDYQPELIIHKLSAPQVAELRDEAFTHTPALRHAYLNEYETLKGMQNYLNAMSNYPLLTGQKSNLFKCFLPQAWMLNTSNGVSAFLHPEGVYDDSKGGRLRKKIYSRLRDHFQFINDQKLFGEVDVHVKYSINIFGADSEEPHFTHVSNLFAPVTIEESFNRYPAEPVGGIKTDQGEWNIIGHPDRIIHVTQKELELFAKLYDKPGTLYNEARLPTLHAQQLVGVLEKLAEYPQRLGNHIKYYYTSQHWNETNAQKDHTIKRQTGFPDTPAGLILSGPHFHVGNSSYKTPQNPCKSNSDYDVIDLTVQPADYLPRTNYVPDCSPEEYFRRTPDVPWDKDKKVTDYYRLVHRRMLNQSSERTAIPAIMQRSLGHLFTAVSTCFMNYSHLLSTYCSMLSLPFDFWMKSTGKNDFCPESLSFVPLISDSRAHLRALMLTCLTTYYSDLWSDCWSSDYCSDGWLKSDPRLPELAFSGLTKNWQWGYALRTDYARREALVEIDVLAARAMGMTLDELCTIYRIQFPVLRQNEEDTWYDRNGRIVFTCNKGLSGVGFSRPEWNEIKDLQNGTVSRTVTDAWLPNGGERVIEYQPPFDRCSREEDYRTVWKNLEK